MLKKHNFIANFKNMNKRNILMADMTILIILVGLPILVEEQFLSILTMC